MSREAKEKSETEDTNANDTLAKEKSEAEETKDSLTKEKSEVEKTNDTKISAERAKAETASRVQVEGGSTGD